MISLEARLRERITAGHKLLVPYVTAGIREDWVDLIKSIAAAGADAIEIGIPFSDPVMDGPTVQAASLRSLERGTSPASALESLNQVELDLPLAVMTYYNLVYRFGHESFASALQSARISGAIIPDLPMEEAADWLQAADAHAIETVMLVAPNTRDARLVLLCERAKGFVYAVSTLGVTGERATLAQSAKQIGDRVRAVTDKPVLIGFGISTPEQAAEAADHADGVIVASALMRRVLEGSSVDEVTEFVGKIRSALS